MQNKPGPEKKRSGTDKDFAIELPASDFDRKMHGLHRLLFIILLAVAVVGIASFLIQAFI